MKRGIYLSGRALQLAALMTLPVSIWVGEFERNEEMAITIFAGSIFLFAAGYFLTWIGSR